MRRAAAATAMLAAMLALPARAEDPPPQGPKVDQPGKLPQPPASAPDLAYDARLMESYAAAKSFQGPLDGGWTLSAAGLGDLYEFQFADKGQVVEGAWRDLRRGHDAKDSGVIEIVQRTPAGLLIRFAPHDAPAATVTLGSNLQGALDQGGRRTAVVLRRTAP
jgi:hypothetical protein